MLGEVIEPSQHEIANGGLVHDRWARGIERIVYAVDIGIFGQKTVDTAT